MKVKLFKVWIFPSIFTCKILDIEASNAKEALDIARETYPRAYNICLQR